MYYEQILSNMLNKLPDNYDKRQGSILYDILAPCALELAAYYQTLEAYLDLSFVETSTGSYLEKRTAELGICLLYTSDLRIKEEKKESKNVKT